MIKSIEQRDEMRRVWRLGFESRRAGWGVVGMAGLILAAYLIELGWRLL